jgi:acyl-CoA hydrolase
MKAKTVAESRVVMTRLMEPGDANFLGKVFGGSILSMLDLVAYTTASKFAGNVCVTASFDRVDFLEPIEVGELVTMEAHVSYVGRTSVEVTIDVYAENIYENSRRHTNTARVLTVAIKDGKPTEVPRLICQTRQEKIEFLKGRARRELRKRHQQELEAMGGDLEVADEAHLDALLAQP